MEYFKLLKRKTITVFWLSQLFSATGDQIYLVSACWLAAQISPCALALVAASEYVSAFLFSFIAGILTDKFNKQKLMICADLGRALAVFTLPIASAFHHVSTGHLVLVGIVLGSLGVLFDPCLVATIPALVDENWLLQATNGLIDFTKRLARALGPALAGLLATFISIHYLLGLNAISFLVSALGVFYISNKIDLAQDEPKELVDKGLFLDTLTSAWGLVQSHRLIAWELFCYFFANVAWAIVYTAGLPLLVRERFGDNIAVYGLLITVYGIASMIANLIIGNRKICQEALSIFWAYLFWGLGFLMLALAPNIVLAGLGMVIAAFAGPVIFITIVTIIQRDIPKTDIGKVYSFRTATMYSGLASGLLLSGYLFSNWALNVVMPCAAAVFLALGISGILRFYRSEKVSNNSL